MAARRRRRHQAIIRVGEGWGAAGITVAAFTVVECTAGWTAERSRRTPGPKGALAERTASAVERTASAAEHTAVLTLARREVDRLAGASPTVIGVVTVAASAPSRSADLGTNTSPVGNRSPTPAVGSVRRLTLDVMPPVSCRARSTMPRGADWHANINTTAHSWRHGGGPGAGQVVPLRQQVGSPSVQVGQPAAERAARAADASIPAADRRLIAAELRDSYFFGANSPFNANTASVTTNNNYLLYPWFYLPFFGYGSGYGLGSGLGYGGGGTYVANYYSNPTNFGYRPTYVLSAPGNARVMTVAAAAQCRRWRRGRTTRSISPGRAKSISSKANTSRPCKAGGMPWSTTRKTARSCLLLGQALFATGQYDEAAGATQAALSMLPEDKWGTVVTHYKELYPNIGDYTTQFRALEKARDAKPDVPALHFLLGYHFGYLNYPKQAVRELDKVLAVAPEDKIAKKLRDEFCAKLSDEDKAAVEKRGRQGRREGQKDTPPSRGPSRERRPATRTARRKATKKRRQQTTKDADDTPGTDAKSPLEHPASSNSPMKNALAAFSTRQATSKAPRRRKITTCVVSSVVAIPARRSR